MLEKLDIASRRRKGDVFEPQFPMNFVFAELGTKFQAEPVEETNREIRIIFA